jgi:hypothetical protein
LEVPAKYLVDWKENKQSKKIKIKNSLEMNCLWSSTEKACEILSVLKEPDWSQLLQTPTT